MTEETAQITTTCAGTSSTLPPFLRLVASREPLVEPDGLGPARGILIGVVLGLAYWALVIGGLVWAMR